MRRILIYSDRSGIYGAEQIDHRLALAFREAGYAVALAQPTACNPLVDERARLGIPHHWLPDENLYNWRNPDPSLTDPAPAERCFDEIRPDLILFTDSFPFANLAAKQAAARRGIPYLVLVHCVQPGWADQFGAFLPALPAVYAAAREVIAVSSENLDLLRRVFGLPPARGRVVHNGRPAIFFAPGDESARRRLRAELNLGEDRIVALSVGRFEWVKGYDLLLEALPFLRRCPVWERLAFVWVGSGTMTDRSRRIARMLGGGRVQILGAREDIPALLDAADLLVHPARFEGMPLVVLEAMAKGLPILATPVSGIPEALGDTGLLLAAPEETLEFKRGLANAICELAGDDERRRVLGNAARRRALDCFTETRMIRDWLDLLRQALAQS